MAYVPDRPVRVKITYPDGSWAKVTVPRVPEEDEWAEGESVEVLGEDASDVYGQTLAPEYSQPAEPKAAAKSKKTAVSGEEAPK
jgi:hypothetical protein